MPIKRSKWKLCAALGKRWYPLYLNHGAMALERDRYNKRLLCIPAGRRSGKTERAKRHIIEHGIKAMYNPQNGVDNLNLFLAAPTYSQAKKIFWNDLKQFLFRFKKPFKDTSDSELRLSIRHPKNEERTVTWWIIGMDNPARMEGMDWDGGICDEFGNTKPDIYTNHIQPALSTPGHETFFWFFGVPEGRNHYYDLAMYVQDRQTQYQDMGYYTWYSSEVLPPETIRRARDVLDPKSFAQEYEASWETKAGLVYYAWDPAKNLDNTLQYNNTLPVYIGMDFNVDPMTAILAHHVVNPVGRTETQIFDAVFLRNSNTRQTMEQILNKYPDAPFYILTPCQSSSARQTSQEIGVTDLRIIEDVFNSRQRILRIAKRAANPLIGDRVNVVNSRLYHRLLKINGEPDGCKELIKDLEALTYKEGTSAIDESNKMRGHISAALGYSEEYHFDIKSVINQKVQKINKTIF